MSSLRFKVVEAAFQKKPLEIKIPKERPSEYFAKYVFNQEKMFKYLPKSTYKKLREVIENGTPLEKGVADEVAAGMKQWAMEMGVTHCTHWFQPLTEGTAEKHDAFVEHDFKGGMIENLREKNSYNKNLTHRLSPTEEFVLHSRPEDILHGIQHLPYLSLATR